MHSLWPLAIALIVLVALLTRLRANKLLDEQHQRQAAADRARLKAPLPLAPTGPITPTAPTAPNEPTVQKDETFAQEHEGQLKQALALRSQINALEAEFSALQEELKDRLQDTLTPQNKALAQECTIAREQLRIAQSYCNELMRFVIAPFQDASSRPYYVPTQDQANWAFTAAKLTLGFAKNRIRSIK